MSLLFTTEPIVVNIDLAEAIGLHEAVALQQVYYWIKKSEHEIDGRFWVYNSIESWQKQFRFWHKDTVKNVFNKLVKMGLLITANYNKSKMDKTTWWAIDFERLGEFEQCISEKYPNRLVKTTPMHKGETPQPIPETTQRQPNIHTCGEVVEKFKIHCPELPEVMGLNDKRESLIKARWHDLAKLKKVDPKNVEVMLQIFADYFSYIATSDFLNGRIPNVDKDKPPFKASFNWVLNSTNYLQIIEKNYHRDQNK